MPSLTSPCLILFTPRAGEGINHAWLVATPNRCDADSARAYSDQAAQSLAGSDYVAACHAVDQVTRGQVRPGAKEYLILAGLPRLNDATRRKLQEALARHLGTLAAAPILPDDLSRGHGLLYVATRLAPIERDLLAIPGSKTAGGAVGSFVGKAFKMLFIIALTMGLAVAFVAKGTGSVLTFIKGLISGYGDSADGSSSDAWAFLNQPEWQRLIALAPLPKNTPTDPQAVWAHALLNELNGIPESSSPMPDDALQLSSHPLVAPLLKALAALPMDTVPGSANPSIKLAVIPPNFLDQWPLSVKTMPGIDDSLLQDLQSFAQAFQTAHPGTTSAVLRQTLVTWDSEVKIYLKVPPDYSAPPPDLPFLTPADALRLKTLKDRLTIGPLAAQFETQAATQKWKGLQWSERLTALMQLKGSPAPLDNSFLRLLQVLTQPGHLPQQVAPPLPVNAARPGTP